MTLSLDVLNAMDRASFGPAQARIFARFRLDDPVGP
jgi:hypothetical protein